MPSPLRDLPDEGVELIKAFEGIPDGDPNTVNIDAYIDPVGIWTIGWGHAIRHGADFLRGAQNKATARALYPGGITRAQAEALLRADLLDTAAAVLRLVKVPIDDGAYGALIAFAFNVGLGALGKSTLLRKLNSGEILAAADQFLVWNKGRINGVLQPLRGLTRRRTAERAMFLGQDWRAAGEVVGASRSRSAAPPMDASARVQPEAPARPKGGVGGRVKPTARPVAKRVKAVESKPPPKAARRPSSTGPAASTAGQRRGRSSAR